MKRQFAAARSRLVLALYEVMLDFLVACGVSAQAVYLPRIVS